MRKKKIKKLLDDTNLKLIEVVGENKQLRERLRQYEQNEAEINEHRNEELAALEDIKAQLLKTTAEYETYKSEVSSRIKDLNAQNDALTFELNSLKGEHFDTCKYAEDLKTKLMSIKKDNDKEDARFENIPLPPPKVSPIVPLEEQDKDAFDYASSVISQAVVEAAKLKTKLISYGGEMANELITLALGKTEILKSDILSTVMSDMVFEAKKQRIDLLYKETEEYFSGLLGQITQ